MLLEWVECEIRRLQGVIAVGVDHQGITVLVLPDVDADAVRVVVSAMLVAAGTEVAVRVIGGVASPERRRHGAPIAAGSVVGIGVLATTVAAALAGALPWPSQAPLPQDQSTSAMASAPERVTAAESGRAVVVPGSQPAWAATEGPWPLPAALPAVQPVVLSTPAPRSSGATSLDLGSATQPLPMLVKTPAPSSTFGPSRLAGASVDLVEIDPVVDEDANENRRRRGHSAQVHGENGLHRGWVQGPAHASRQSAASEAPRGGR